MFFLAAFLKGGRWEHVHRNTLNKPLTLIIYIKIGICGCCGGLSFWCKDVERVKMEVLKDIFKT